MSTQKNIGFYKDLTKIIFQLSSNMHLMSSRSHLIMCCYLREGIATLIQDHDQNTFIPGTRYSVTNNPLFIYYFT